MPPARTCRLAIGIAAVVAVVGVPFNEAFAQPSRAAVELERGLNLGASVLLVDYNGGTLDLGLGARATFRLTQNLALAADAAYVAAREGPVCPPFRIITDGCRTTRLGLFFVGGGFVALLPRRLMTPYGGVSHGWRFRKSPDHAGWDRAFSPSLFVGLAFPVSPGSLFAETRVRGELERDPNRLRWPGIELAFGIAVKAP